MRDEEVDVVGMERKQMIVDVLVLPLPLLPKQKKKKKMVVITVNDLAVAVEWRFTLQGSINDNNKDGPNGI